VLASRVESKGYAEVIRRDGGDSRLSSLSFNYIDDAETFKMLRGERTLHTDYLAILADIRLFTLLISGQIHWNNVYVASLARYDRIPSDKHRADILRQCHLLSQDVI